MVQMGLLTSHPSVKILQDLGGLSGKKIIRDG